MGRIATISTVFPHPNTTANKRQTQKVGRKILPMR